MLEKIISLENLFSAWREFRSGKQHKPEVMIFERRLEDNLFALYEDLSTNQYRHQSYQNFYVWDPKFRLINKAAVRDRIVHHLVYKYLEKIFQPTFIYHSYSSQVGKGLHKAVVDLKMALRQASKNYKTPLWSLKMDIKKFFASVDHQILLRQLEKRVYDPDVRWLLEEIIHSYATPGQSGRGIPIGNLSSQIFANIYLHELDTHMKFSLREKYYFRYADDFILLARDRGRLEGLQLKICQFLATELKLAVHPQKIVLRKFSQGIDWLGYVLLPHYSVLRTRTKKRMFKKIDKQIKRYNDSTIGDYELNQSLQSYYGLLKHCSGYGLEQELKNRAWLNMKK